MAESAGDVMPSVDAKIMLCSFVFVCSCSINSVIAWHEMSG